MASVQESFDQVEVTTTEGVVALASGQLVGEGIMTEVHRAVVVVHTAEVAAGHQHIVEVPARVVDPVLVVIIVIGRVEAEAQKMSGAVTGIVQIEMIKIIVAHQIIGVRKRMDRVDGKLLQEEVLALIELVLAKSDNLGHRRSGVRNEVQIDQLVVMVIEGRAGRELPRITVLTDAVWSLLLHDLDDTFAVLWPLWSRMVDMYLTSLQPLEKLGVIEKMARQKEIDIMREKAVMIVGKGHTLLLLLTEPNHQ